MEPKKEQSNLHEPVTRRSFLLAGAAVAGGMTVIPAAGQRSPKPSSFIELQRAPDGVTAYSSFSRTMPAGRIPLQPTGVQWRGGQIVVETAVEQNALVLTLAAPSTPVAVVHVRWRSQVTPGLRALGDAWERSYGELGWRDLIPERVMPWYFATHDGEACHGYGVKTDAAALCFWQLDPEGVSLWLNVANGGNGVELGPRRLTMATVVSPPRRRWRGALTTRSRGCAGPCAPVHRGPSCPSMEPTTGATAMGTVRRRRSCGIRSSSSSSRPAEVCGLSL